MRNWGIATYILVAAVIGLAISVILGLNQMIEKRESFQTDPRVEVWLVSQVELERLKLVSTLDAFHYTEAGTSLDELLTRFDIFWSRLLVLKEGGESERLREVEGLNQTVLQVISGLERVEPEILNLKKGDTAAYQSIHDGLTAMAGPIHTMVINTTNHDRGLRIETASARSDIFWQVVGYFIGVLVSGTILVLFLLWKNRETNRLLALEKEVELSSMKSNFVATASHEFRTPLTTIFSAADLLHHYSDQMDEKQRLYYLEEIKQEVGDMTQLLDDILIVRKMEAGMFSFSPQKSNIELLLRNIVRASQNMAGNVHAINLNISCDGSNVSIDDSLIRHIVNNLLSNAIKYSPDGESIEVSLARQNGEIILDVADSGIGIPEEDIDRVFDTFFRADNSSGIGGTGLGLSVVKTAVELHGGRITVDSIVDEGTTFSVRIPDSDA
ncbi:MAG: hypothetical protein CMM31_09380 [Rhodospirillaceae bacterium]|nr:hypothetical protein [Rhodospirillaceae bacterium]